MMLMRFTLIDESGTISFVGPGHILKMLAASIDNNELSIKKMLDGLTPLDETVAAEVKRGLALFDEHCLRAEPETIVFWVGKGDRLDAHPFRVLDAVTRNASLNPDKLGLVIFNLIERRIVQVQNSYGALHRHDRGRIRNDGRPVGRYYHYELPEEWSVVP